MCSNIFKEFSKVKKQINGENQRSEKKKNLQVKGRRSSLWIDYVLGVEVQGTNQIWEYLLCMVIALEPNPES